MLFYTEQVALLKMPSSAARSIAQPMPNAVSPGGATGALAASFLSSVDLFIPCLILPPR